MHACTHTHSTIGTFTLSTTPPPGVYLSSWAQPSPQYICRWCSEGLLLTTPLYWSIITHAEVFPSPLSMAELDQSGICCLVAIQHTELTYSSIHYISQWFRCRYNNVLHKNYCYILDGFTPEVLFFKNQGHVQNRKMLKQQIRQVIVFRQGTRK